MEFLLPEIFLPLAAYVALLESPNESSYPGMAGEVTQVFILINWWWQSGV